VRNTTLLILFWWLATLGSLAQASGKLSAPSQVNVQYRFQEGSITLNEPVVLLFSVHNGLSQPMMLALGARKTEFFRFSLRTPEGRTLQDSRNPGDYVSVVIFGPLKTTVEPGADYQQPILMNEWFRFETVGTYLLTSQLTAGIETSEGTPLPQEGQTARLVVKPRDPERLENICAMLAREVEDHLSVEEWQFPAWMLSSVNDPIAVPYLSQVLATNKGAENFVVPALERISDDEAVNALVSALSDKSGDVAMLARQSLTRMQAQIKSPGLRETVRQALASKPESNATREF
jgi:hypothetical protein